MKPDVDGVVGLAASGSYQSHESGFAALPKCLAAGHRAATSLRDEAFFRLEHKPMHVGMGTDHQPALCGSLFA